MTNHNPSHNNDDQRKFNAKRRKIEPPRKAPKSERGLTHSPYFNAPLYQRMSEDLHLGGMSKRTHEGYLRAMRELADFCKCSPDRITEDQLRKFFLHLKNDKAFASGSLRVAFSGVKFFYTRTCRREWQTLPQMKIQNVKSLPEVLTIEQVHQIINCCRTQRMAVFFWTVYSLGLRLEEALNLHVGDIDSKRMMVLVHRGKGAKDRYIPLPQSTLLMLRGFWLTHKHRTFVFPADGRDLGWTFRLGSGVAPQPARYESKRPPCEHCGGVLHLIAITNSSGRVLVSRALPSLSLCWLMISLSLIRSSMGAITASFPRLQP